MDPLSPLSVQNTLEPYVTSVSYRWRDALGNGTKSFFNDPEKIWPAIKDGRALYTSFDQSPGSTRDDYKRTMFAAALPYVWSTSTDRKSFESLFLQQCAQNAFDEAFTIVRHTAHGISQLYTLSS